MVFLLYLCPFTFFLSGSTHLLYVFFKECILVLYFYPSSESLTFTDFYILYIYVTLLYYFKIYNMHVLMYDNIIYQFLLLWSLLYHLKPFCSFYCPTCFAFLFLSFLPSLMLFSPSSRISDKFTSFYYFLMIVLELGTSHMNL